jgi:hypothetical protein
MKLGTIAGWALAAVLTSIALSSVAQQDDGPILRPKKPVAHASEPTTFEMERQAKKLFDQKRFSEARPLFEQACAAGSWDSCLTLSVSYIQYRGELPPSSRSGKTFSEAVSVFERRCANGQADACGHLGYMYQNAIGVPENGSLSFSYSSKACGGGDGPACIEVGLGYEYGHGIKQDYSQAALVYARSCNARNAACCRLLGSLYHRGLGVERDDSRAEELFSNACKLGDDTGCREIKEMNNVGRQP